MRRMVSAYGVVDEVYKMWIDLDVDSWGVKAWQPIRWRFVWQLEINKHLHAHFLKRYRMIASTSELISHTVDGSMERIIAETWSCSNTPSPVQNHSHWSKLLRLQMTSRAWRECRTTIDASEYCEPWRHDIDLSGLYSVVTMNKLWCKQEVMNIEWLVAKSYTLEDITLLLPSTFKETKTLAEWWLMYAVFVQSRAQRWQLSRLRVQTLRMSRTRHYRWL